MLFFYNFEGYNNHRRAAIDYELEKNNRHMKHSVFVIAALSGILLQAVRTEACTNLIVGKKASADGSVMVSYNYDGVGSIFSSSLTFVSAGRHEPGEFIAVRHQNDSSQVYYFPQVPYTYSVKGHMNEKQVALTETTWNGRKELHNKDGIITYRHLMSLALQRASTAREAIAIIHNLSQEHGYNSTGESIAVCDKNEAWLMEIIGKGPGRKGSVWVALRIPDDCVCATANCSRIRQFPQTRKVDKKLGFCVVPDVCMYSADVISFAKEMGYYSGPDADFSFRDAYCPLNFRLIRNCEARVWSFFRHHYSHEAMDAYLPFLNGDLRQHDHLPMWIKPDAPLSYRDLQNDMRDHYEGTALDMTVDMSAGPWASPYRDHNTFYEGPEGEKMFHERPIGCAQSVFAMVCRMRSWLPDAVGGVTYMNYDDATTVAYVPVYCGVSRMPAQFRRENNAFRRFSENSAFWMCNFVSNMVYPRYSAMIGDLRIAQKELEDYYEEDQKRVEAEVLAMKSSTDVTNYLTLKCEAYTDKMMARWKKLAEFLIVRHNDQVMYPVENGEVRQKGRRATPAYSPSFTEAIRDRTGDRYVVKELIR